SRLYLITRCIVILICAMVSLSCVCITAKPGVCPRRKFGAGMCAEFCVNDSDCPNNEKCCSNGCGHECTAPYTGMNIILYYIILMFGSAFSFPLNLLKPGRCALPKGTPMCAEYCYHDGQCPAEQKCCPTTCGHACSEPC
uniref:WAP four-disulfide core domain 2 n=1 Tax=Sinocyclocheilus rhinocerous TaxID=307959 RepID=A0A673JI39_9TELE